MLTVLGYIHLAKFAKTCGIYISFSAPQLHWDELLLNELGSILLLVGCEDISSAEVCQEALDNDRCYYENNAKDCAKTCNYCGQGE